MQDSRFQIVHEGSDAQPDVVWAKRPRAPDCLSVCLVICLSGCLSVCLFVCLFTFVCLSVCLFVCLFIVCFFVCLSSRYQAGTTLVPSRCQAGATRHQHGTKRRPRSPAVGRGYSRVRTAAGKRRPVAGAALPFVPLTAAGREGRTDRPSDCPRWVARDAVATRAPLVGRQVSLRVLPRFGDDATEMEAKLMVDANRGGTRARPRVAPLPAGCPFVRTLYSGWTETCLPARLG
jgi:hypothetical protein